MNGKKNFCMYCLQHFSSEKILNNHKENCILINGTQGITMPTNNEKILKFNGFNKQLPIPFVIYADFEAITEKIHSCQPNDKTLKLIKIIKTVDMVIRLFVVMMINSQKKQ